jgi:hypothetical protein
MKMATRMMKLAAATMTKMTYLGPEKIPPKNGWGALNNQCAMACREEKGEG